MDGNMIGVADHIRQHGRDRPDVIALVFEGQETSYADLDRNTSRVANALIAAGLAPGARIAYLGKNRDIY
ncbi:MAG: AMP-binding protein, partial [Sphingobium sp.]